MKLSSVMEKNNKLLSFLLFVSMVSVFFSLELLLREIFLIVRNFSHSKESDSFITLVYSTDIFTDSKLLQMAAGKYLRA